MTQEENKTVPLVLLSGGMDSTFMVQWMLEYTDVETLYVEANGHPMKNKKECEAREKLFRLFKKHAKHQVLNDHQFKLNDVYRSNPQISGVQQISWLTAGLCVYDEARHNSLNIGYVLGDQAPAFRQQYEEFWRAGWIMTRGHLSPVPPLVFPILNHQLTKYDVINRIDKRLVTSTWVCELPELHGEGMGKRIKSCGHCNPCRLLKNTIGDWELKNRRSYMKDVIMEMNPELYPRGNSKLLDCVVE